MRFGRGLILAVMVLLLVTTVVLAAVQVWLPVAVGLTVVAIPFLIALYRRDDVNLFIVLGAFVLISGYESGLQPEEVIYGLYFTSFLFVWYFRQTYTFRRRLVTGPEDVSVLVFGVFVVASSSWALLFGARVSAIVGELLVLAMLAFYFPAKEACLGNPNVSLRRFIFLFVWLGLFVFTRNLIEYLQGVHSAEYLFELMHGRVALNEILFTMPALASLVFLISVPQWRVRFASALIFLICLTGLILTQSRGYWVAFAFGVLALVVLVERTARRRLLRFAVIGLLTLGISAALALPRVFDVFVLGIVDRVATIGTALTTDISMVNRMYETSALWERIKANPILGYGTGARFQYWSLTFQHTTNYPFVHNAFAGLWFKYGLVGLILALFIWVRTIWSGVKLYKSKDLDLMPRIIGLSIAVCLIAEFPVANTSNPFLITDGVLVFSLFAGIASGLRQRYSNNE